jgi:transposase
MPAPWVFCCGARGFTPRTWPPWRRQRKQGGIDALTPKKRGPKVVVSPLVKENREQQVVIARLTKKLKNAELIIEVQKKVAALLGNPIPTIRIDEENS